MCGGLIYIHCFEAVGIRHLVKDHDADVVGLWAHSLCETASCAVAKAQLPSRGTRHSAPQEKCCKSVAAVVCAFGVWPTTNPLCVFFCGGFHP